MKHGPRPINFEKNKASVLCEFPPTFSHDTHTFDPYMKIPFESFPDP